MDIFCDLEQYKDRIAIIDENENSYSYTELCSMVKRFQQAINEYKKCLILVKSRNTVEALVGYLGGIASGNTVLMIDNSVDNELVENIIGSYRPEFIWQPSGSKRDTVYSYNTYELVRTNHETNSAIYSELSLVMLTSGSTGSPKGVRLTKDNLNSNAKSIAKYLELDNSERPITNLPITYVYGLSVINSHLYVGATILLTNNSIIKPEFWGFFKKHKATSFTGVPYTYEMLKVLHFSDMNVPSLRYFTQAGGKLPEELASEYVQYSKNKNVKFYIMYGQTEATARISYLPPEFNYIKKNSIGIAIPDGKLNLREESGEYITEPRKEGLLYYEGKNVMLGYAHNRLDLSKGDEQKGCLNTNDIACFDEEGFYYIVGRQSRFIKILGKRINLEEIEHHLKHYKFNCAVGGRDELLVIAVTDESISQEIRKIIIRKFKLDYDNVDIFQVKELMKNSSGKTNYEEIFSSYKGR